MNEQNELITTQEAMNLLHCSRMTFYRYVVRYGFTSPDKEHRGGRGKQQHWYAQQIYRIADALKVTKGK